MSTSATATIPATSAVSAAARPGERSPHGPPKPPPPRRAEPLFGQGAEDRGRLAARLAHPRGLERQRALEIVQHLLDRLVAVARFLGGGVVHDRRSVG